MIQNKLALNWLSVQKVMKIGSGILTM